MNYELELEEYLEEGDKMKQDRLEIVLADSERILNRVHERLDRITRRQIEMEKLLNVIDSMEYYKEWKSTREEVI